MLMKEVYFSTAVVNSVSPQISRHGDDARDLYLSRDFAEAFKHIPGPTPLDLIPRRKYVVNY